MLRPLPQTPGGLVQDDSAPHYHDTKVVARRDSWRSPLYLHRATPRRSLWSQLQQSPGPRPPAIGRELISFGSGAFPAAGLRPGSGKTVAQSGRMQFRLQEQLERSVHEVQLARSWLSVNSTGPANGRAW